MKKLISILALSLFLAGCTPFEVLFGAAAAGLGGYVIGREHNHDRR